MNPETKSKNILDHQELIEMEEVKIKCEYRINL